MLIFYISHYNFLRLFTCHISRKGIVDFGLEGFMSSSCMAVRLEHSFLIPCVPKNIFYAVCCYNRDLILMYGIVPQNVLLLYHNSSPFIVNCGGVSCLRVLASGG